jgi:hypothetical protein
MLTQTLLWAFGTPVFYSNKYKILVKINLSFSIKTCLAYKANPFGFNNFSLFSINSHMLAMQPTTISPIFNKGSISSSKVTVGCNSPITARAQLFTFING